MQGEEEEEEYDEDEADMVSDELDGIELEEWDDVRMCWSPSSNPASTAGASERSSQSSQPIAIPATT